MGRSSDSSTSRGTEATMRSSSTPKTRGSFQRQGIGRRLVSLAAEHVEAAGCEWLHVDFDPELRPFYLEARGFTSTEAGLIHFMSRVR